MANMSQILTFDPDKKYSFEVTFPPENFIKETEIPFLISLRMTDQKIKENDTEVKVFCAFERLMGVEKISKWTNYFNSKYHEICFGNFKSIRFIQCF